MDQNKLLERSLNSLKTCRSETQVDGVIQTIQSHIAPHTNSAYTARMFWTALSKKIGSYRSIREDQSGNALNALYKYAADQAAKKAKALTPSR